MLYRVFPFSPSADPIEDGGALHVPSALQGAGRHDNPDLYVAYYASRSAASVVAELLRRFRTSGVSETDLRSEYGRRYAIASLDDSRLPPLVDLDDPRMLVERSLRPSGVATRNRRATQAVARAIYDDGETGFEWWSTIEASWINVTLFSDRSVPRLSLAANPVPLTTDHPTVVEAAEAAGVELG